MFLQTFSYEVPDGEEVLLPSSTMILIQVTREIKLKPGERIEINIIRHEDPNDDVFPMYLKQTHSSLRFEANEGELAPVGDEDAPKEV